MKIDINDKKTTDFNLMISFLLPCFDETNTFVESLHFDCLCSYDFHFRYARIGNGRLIMNNLLLRDGLKSGKNDTLLK